MIAGVSHDLRTPLTSVKGFIKGLRDGVAATPKKQEQYLSIAYQKACDICREIRDKVDIPILMVTARTESVDKIRGLGLGADDYIAKPFAPAELVARVKSHLNRYHRLIGSIKNGNGDDGFMLADLKILPRSWRVYKGDSEIKFPNREFELLLFLAENPNIVFSKEQLFEKIWGFDYVGDSATATVHINRIREKIEDDPSKPKIIETVWGAGYRLNR